MCRAAAPRGVGHCQDTGSALGGPVGILSPQAEQSSTALQRERGGRRKGEETWPDPARSYFSLLLLKDASGVQQFV